MEENKQSFSTNNPEISQAVAIPQSSGNWWKIGILVVGILLAGSITYAGWQFSQKQTLPPLPTPMVQPTSTPTPDPTANWKTYTNKKYHYVFRYPNNWYLTDYGSWLQIDDRLNRQGEVLGHGITFSVFPTTTQGIKINDSVGASVQIGGILEEKIEDIMVDGKKAAKTKITILPNSQTDALPGLQAKIPVNNEVLWVRTQGNDPKYGDVLDQILSTFRFLE